MAVSGFEPTPLDEPHTESVPGGRRAAVVVIVAGFLVVGALIWKPWDNGRSASAAPPEPSNSLPAMAATTTSPSPAATAKATHEPLPTSNFESRDEVAPGDLGTVSLPSGDTPFVFCTYGRAAGFDSALTTMLITPPMITTGNAVALGLVKRVTYRPEIEANALEGIFSAEWRFVAAGRTQHASLSETRFASFKTLQVKVPARDLESTGVMRVAVVINWIGTDGRLLASQRVHPTTYAPLGDGNADPVAEGCPAHN